MFELWARRRTTRRYEFITTFEDEMQKFYLMDQLDRDVYEEAMILQNQKCKLYREFEKSFSKVLQKTKKHDTI